MRDEATGVRPSVMAIAAVLVLGCAFAIYEAFSFDPLAVAASAERGPVSRPASRSVRSPHAASSRASTHRTAGHATSGAGYQHHDWGQETEFARAIALGLPGPTFWRDVESRGIPENDPQIAAMWRSFHMMSSPEGDPSLPFEPTAHRAILVDSAGDVSANPASCDVRVLPVRSGPFNCVVRVMCDGQVLYPNPTQTAGYMPCELGEDGRIVRAVDSGHTASDGDPLVDLDFSNGTITVEELDESGHQRYRATLRITS